MKRPRLSSGGTTPRPLLAEVHAQINLSCADVGMTKPQCHVSHIVRRLKHHKRTTPLPEARELSCCRRTPKPRRRRQRQVFRCRSPNCGPDRSHAHNLHYRCGRPALLREPILEAVGMRLQPVNPDIDASAMPALSFCHFVSLRIVCSHREWPAR
ncbi:hypothetical protein AGR4B_pAt20423 [Agrobacterium tumefaciens str. CFBP 5621]|nr:hypothetical protein AGR4B_pAt20423 [Agrobacterium tumefaciens str. CFBP 5621]